VPVSPSLLLAAADVVVVVVAAVGNTNECALVLLPSLAAATVLDDAMGKPKAAGGDGESPDAVAGAEPKPPN
jgi:hypothetical protein